MMTDSCLHADIWVYASIKLSSQISVLLALQCLEKHGSVLLQAQAHAQHSPISWELSS